ncbi:MAG TPA: hypothetical protein EYN51_05885 [Flavobacteriales bacterium]|nr:hypothetical protein [Flavobacteriales bacterium]
MKQILSFDFEHGHVEGAYWGAASENAPLLVITNGHNGFYSYGMLWFLVCAANFLDTFSFIKKYSKKLTALFFLEKC